MNTRGARAAPPLGRLVGALAQRRERGAFLLVGADDLRDGVERPVLELGALLAAAAHELLAGAILAAIAPEILGVAAAPPLVEAACAPAIAALARAIEAAILHASLPAILVLILALILSLTLVLVLGLILPAALPAVLSLILGVARAPPVVEARWTALAVAVITVMAAAGVGARGHAHHQHRRKQQRRLQHGSRPRWSSPLTTRETASGSLLVRGRPHASPPGLTRGSIFLARTFFEVDGLPGQARQ